MKKSVIIAVVIVVILGVAAVAAFLTTQRVTYDAGDLVISGSSTCAECTKSVNLMKEAAEGTGVNIRFVDPKANPKAIPTSDQVNMETEGAMLYFQADGDHTHDVVVQYEGHVTDLEQAKKLIQTALGTGQQNEAMNITYSYGGDGCENCVALQGIFKELNAQYNAQGLTFTYYDLATQKDEAAKVGLTQVHTTVISDTQGRTKTYPGELGTTKDAVVENLNKMTLE